ncbi:proteasome activator complex subunit 4, partial [Biomphalaria pfeifferi]
LKMLNRSNFELTIRHLDILKDLLELSVSRYKTLENLWLWITPLLEHALNNITLETDSSWTCFFFYICNNRAPQRLQWLYRLLLKNPVNGDGGSFWGFFIRKTHFYLSCYPYLLRFVINISSTVRLYNCSSVLLYILTSLNNSFL